MTAEELDPVEIEWINDTVARMRTRGEYGEDGFGRLWLFRIGATTTTTDQAHVVQIWPPTRVDLIGMRAFGPVEIMHLQTLSGASEPCTTILVGRPLEHYAIAPFTELDLAGPIHAERGLALTFRATHEAREIDVFLVGIPVSEDAS